MAKATVKSALDAQATASSAQATTPQNSSPQVDFSPSAQKAPFEPESGLWATLRDAPSEYSHNEALLLCETETGAWVSWVPGYGEITLSRSQFHH